MDQLAPLGPVYQAGTLSGNPLATAAGLAVLALLDAASYDRARGHRHPSRRRPRAPRSTRPAWPRRSTHAFTLSVCSSPAEAVRDYDEAARRRPRALHDVLPRPARRWRVLRAERLRDAVPEPRPHRRRHRPDDRSGRCCHPGDNLSREPDRSYTPFVARGARRAGRTRHRERVARRGRPARDHGGPLRTPRAPFAYTMVHSTGGPITSRRCRSARANAGRAPDPGGDAAVRGCLGGGRGEHRAVVEVAERGSRTRSPVWIRALGRGIPVVPPPVRSRFEVLLANVRRGELEVRSDASFNEVAFNGYVEVDAAHASYGAASKLVGDACGSLYVVTGGSVAPSRQLADMFAGIAKWVCGPQHTRCPPSPPTTLRSSGSRR